MIYREVTIPGFFAYPNYNASGLRLLADGYGGEISAGLFGATLKVSIDMAFLYDYLFYVYGLPGTAGQIGLGMPMTHPFQAFLYADHASWTAEGISENSCDWKIAIITIHFRTLPYDQTLRSVQMKIAGQFVTLPSASFTFPSDGTSVQGAGILVPECEFQIAYHRQIQSLINYPLMSSLAGTVNEADLTIGSALEPPALTFSTGTILYTGSDVSIETSVGGYTVCTVTHNLSYRQILHVYLLNSNSGIWEAPTNASGGHIYDSADLSVLLP